MDEVRYAVKNNLPIIVVKGSNVCDEIIQNLDPVETDPEMVEMLNKGHFYLLDSIESEDIA